MRILKLILLSTFMINLANAQGINFDASDWNKIVEKAKSEKKLIYVDVYTDWCPGCKVISKTIFPLTEVGNYYNKHFINVKMNAEKGEGIAFAKKFNVKGYPTFIFLKPDGETEIYRTMGAKDKKDFIGHGTWAVQEYKSPKPMADFEREFNKGNRDKAFLEDYLRRLDKSIKDNSLVLDAYFDKYISDKPSESEVSFLTNNCKSFNSKTYKFLEKNKDEVVKNFKLQGNTLKSFSSYLEIVIYYYSKIANKERSKKKLEACIEKQKEINSGAEYELAILNYKLSYYEDDKQKEREITQTYSDYMSAQDDTFYKEENEKMKKKYIAKQVSTWKALGESDSLINVKLQYYQKAPQLSMLASSLNIKIMNDVSWKVYEENKDQLINKKEVSKAIKHAKRASELALATGQFPAIADTYARLLFINGNKKEAIAVMQKAVDMLEKNKSKDLEEYKKELDKMKAG